MKKPFYFFGKSQFVFFLVPFFIFIYILALRAYYVGFFNDDAFYIIGSKSLIQGSYRELNQPGAPPFVSYLPGYPLLLTPFSLLFPHTTLPHQLFSVLLTAASLNLFRLYYKDHVSKPVLLS